MHFLNAERLSELLFMYIHFLNALSEKLISCLSCILYYVIAFLFYVSLRSYIVDTSPFLLLNVVNILPVHGYIFTY